MYIARSNMICDFYRINSSNSRVMYFFGRDVYQLMSEDISPGHLTHWPLGNAAVSPH